MGIEQKSDGRSVQLKGVILSFTDTLYEKGKPQGADEDAEPSHGCNIILPSDSKFAEENKKKVISALRAASEQKWKNPDAWKSIAEDAPKRVAFRKGERFRNRETGEVYEGYEGNWAISGKGPKAGKSRPKLLDRRKREVPEKDILEVMYSGTLADVVVSFYGTDKGSRGVFVSIDAIRSWEEGERIGGGGINVDADDFDDLEDPEDDMLDGDDFGGGSESGSSSVDDDLDLLG